MKSSATSTSTPASAAAQATRRAIEQGRRIEKTARFAVEISRAARRHLAKARAPQMAAALSYRTIFSLIPVLVLALILLKALYGPDAIRSAFDQVMSYTGIAQIELSAPELADGAASLPGPMLELKEAPALPSDQQIALSEWLREFIDNATDRIATLNTGAIAAVGIALFIYSALSLLIQIEQSFNTICNAATGRRLISRLTNYWTFLTLGGVALAVTIALSDAYWNALSDLPGWASWVSTPLKWIARLGVTWLLLLFAYTRMPNTHVRLSSAAIGALVAGVAWELAKSGLAWFIGFAMAGQLAIYGSLALIPLFLLWVYVTWLIVLYGLELANALQRSRNGNVVERERPHGDAILDPASCIPVVREIVIAFRDGKSMSSAALARRTGMAEPLLRRVLDKLVERHMLHRVAGEDEEESYALARPPESIRLEEVMEALSSLSGWPDDAAPKHSGRAGSVDDLVASIRERQRRALAGLTAASLVPAEANAHGQPHS